MTIEDINAAVSSMQQLAESAPDEAMAKRDALFGMLIKRDEFYIGDIHPIAEGDPRLFLRVFTHPEFLSADICTSLELMKQLRSLMLAGDALGIIINDGAAWFALTLAEALGIFLDVVDAPGNDPDFVEYLELRAYVRMGLASDDVDVGEIELPSGRKINADRLERMKQYIAAPPEGVLSLALDIPNEEDEPCEEMPGTPEPAEKPAGKQLRWHKRDKAEKSGKPLPIKKLAIAGAALLLVLIVALCFRSCGHSQLDNLEDALGTADFVRAEEVYSQMSEDKQAEADALLDEYSMFLVSEYAEDKIGRIELDARLSALRKFGSKRVDIANEALRQIELSRNAYADGLECETVAERLQCWRGVIEADARSWNAMNENLAENSESYKEDILKLVDARTSYGLQGRAYYLCELLYERYPDDEKVSEKLSSLLSYKESSDSNLSDEPFEISGISISDPARSDGLVDLFIHWRNLSTKRIEKISFTVLPVNVAGEAVSNRYIAEDLHGYESGEGPESETWGWSSVWNNAGVVSVVVESVEIRFEDGVTGTFALK